MSNAADAAPRRVSAWREYWPCGLALLWLAGTANADAGFMLGMFAVFVFPIWLVRMGTLTWRRPARRRAQGIKLVVLVVAMVAAGAALKHREDDRRAQAQRVVEAVTAWHDAHGAWPDTLDQVGLDTRALRHEQRIFYFIDKGHATLFHASVYMPLDTWGWDFDKKAWQYHAD